MDVAVDIVSKSDRRLCKCSRFYLSLACWTVNRSCYLCHKPTTTDAVNSNTVDEVEDLLDEEDEAGNNMDDGNGFEFENVPIIGYNYYSFYVV